MTGLTRDVNILTRDVNILALKKTLAKTSEKSFMVARFLQKFMTTK